MPKKSPNAAARRALENAISAVIYQAKRFTADRCESNCTDLLSAAREYGRALNRVETLRRR